MAKKKRGGAAKKEPRLTAARFVSQRYGEKGLRALKAMGPEFAKGLQREIIEGRTLGDLSRRLMAAKLAFEKAQQRVDDAEALLSGAKSCVPQLEAVINALPDVEPKKKAEAPAEEAEVAAEVA